MICQGCYGSKKVLGTGMIYKDCPICSSSISIRYKKAIKEMQNKFNLSEEDATRIFAEESARIDRDSDNDNDKGMSKNGNNVGRPRKNNVQT